MGQSSLPVLEKKRCQAISFRLQMGRLGCSLTWVHFALTLYQLICHGDDTGYLRTRGRTNCCHYILMRSQSSSSSSNLPDGKQVPWPAAHKLIVNSPDTLLRLALGGQQHLHTLCGLFGEFPLPALPRRPKSGTPNAKPLLHHSYVLWSPGCCWCPGLPNNALGNYPFLPIITLCVRTEVRLIGGRNNIRINFSLFSNDPGHGRPHQWSFLSTARDGFGLLFACSIVISTLSNSVCRSNTSTPAHERAAGGIDHEHTSRRPP